jgi:hypothetical protein
LQVDGSVYIRSTTGNIGIGTWLPNVGLAVGAGAPSWTVAMVNQNDAYVAGDVEIDGALYVDGFIYGNGSKITGISGTISGLTQNSLSKSNAAGTGLVDSAVYNVNSNVGIGTSAPNAGLEVQMTGSISPFMISSVATLDGDYLVVTSAGNVGIGSALPRTKLEIGNSAGFSSEYDNGNSGASKTINWINGNKQRITLTAATVTLTLTSPNVVGNFLLTIIQDGTGGRTISWPASVKWPNGVAPTLSTAAGAMDVVTFYYNGSNYLGCASLNFQ